MPRKSQALRFPEVLQTYLCAFRPKLTSIYAGRKGPSSPAICRLSGRNQQTLNSVAHLGFLESFQYPPSSYTRSLPPVEVAKGHV